MSFAGHTQNRRLLARAYISLGLTLAAGPSPDLDGARRVAEEAIALVQPETSEGYYVWDDLETLKARVLRAHPVDALLRAWSAGIVENQSFQQVEEEFARIVIPKVWEREGRKDFARGGQAFHLAQEGPPDPSLSETQRAARRLTHQPSTRVRRTIFSRRVIQRA